MAKINIDLTNYLDFVAPCYHDLWDNDARFFILTGSASSGKSTAIAQWILYELLCRPYHRFMVVRKTYSTIKDSVFKQLISVIQRQGMQDLFEWSDAQHAEPYIKCIINGNEVLARGMDDVEKLKSITDITGIFIEEGTEIEEYRDFLQLDLRLRYDCDYLRFIVANNPTDPDHWIKVELIDKMGLVSGKTKYIETPVEQEDGSIEYVKVGYYHLHTLWKNNPFLSKETKAGIIELSKKDEYYNRVYNLGLWSRPEKYSVFNVPLVSARIERLKGQVYTKGYFTIRDDKYVFTPFNDGYIKLYVPPKKGIPYVMSVDTKTTGKDFYAVHVIDNTTQEQCATIHISDIVEITIAKQIEMLGRLYNDAYCIIERNHSSYIPNKLREWDYPHLYTEGDVVGVFTQKVNKPAMVENLIAFVNDHINNINDVETLKEMFDFTRDKTSFSAIKGKYDDLVMSLAICLYYRGGQSDQEDKPIPPSRAWLAGVRDTPQDYDDYTSWD